MQFQVRNHFFLHSAKESDYSNGINSTCINFSPHSLFPCDHQKVKTRLIAFRISKARPRVYRVSLSYIPADNLKLSPLRDNLRPVHRVQ